MVLDLLMYLLAYVSVSGGFPLEDPASRALLGYVGSDIWSGLSHTNLCSNPLFHDESHKQSTIPAGTSPGSTKSPTGGSRRANCS